MTLLRDGTIPVDGPPIINFAQDHTYMNICIYFHSSGAFKRTLSSQRGYFPVGYFFCALMYDAEHLHDGVSTFEACFYFIIYIHQT